MYHEWTVVLDKKNYLIVYLFTVFYPNIDSFSIIEDFSCVINSSQQIHVEHREYALPQLSITFFVDYLTKN